MHNLYIKIALQDFFLCAMGTRNYKSTVFHNCLLIAIRSYHNTKCFCVNCTTPSETVIVDMETMF